MIKWIVGKLNETSTWKGLIWLLTACGVVLSTEQQEAIVATGIALTGAVEVFISKD